MNEEFKMCECCNKKINASQIHILADKIFCSECYENETFECDCCHKRFFSKSVALMVTLRFAEDVAMIHIIAAQIVIVWYIQEILYGTMIILIVRIVFPMMNMMKTRSLDIFHITITSRLLFFTNATVKKIYVITA